MMVRGRGLGYNNGVLIFELSAKPWDAKMVEVREDGMAWPPCSLESVGS